MFRQVKTISKLVKFNEIWLFLKNKYSADATVFFTFNLTQKMHRHRQKTLKFTWFSESNKQILSS